MPRQSEVADVWRGKNAPDGGFVGNADDGGDEEGKRDVLSRAKPDRSYNPKIFLAILSTNTPEGALRRHTIRQTWLPCLLKSSSFAVSAAFFVGRPSQSAVRPASHQSFWSRIFSGSKVRPGILRHASSDESVEEDVITLNVGDDYLSLVSKVQHMWRWVAKRSLQTSQQCGSALTEDQYPDLGAHYSYGEELQGLPPLRGEEIALPALNVPPDCVHLLPTLSLKIDDDALICPSLLSQLLRDTCGVASWEPSKLSYVGRLEHLPVSRDPNSKFYTPARLWPSYFWPHAMGGLFYGISAQLLAATVGFPLATPGMQITIEDQYQGVLVDRVEKRDGRKVDFCYSRPATWVDVRYGWGSEFSDAAGRLLAARLPAPGMGARPGPRPPEGACEVLAEVPAVASHAMNIETAAADISGHCSA